MLDGTRFRDSGGVFFGLGCSFFPAAWAYISDRARLIADLKYLQQFGFDHLRVFGALGPSAPWDTRTIDPRVDNYRSVIAATTDLIAEYGMRTQWTLFGGVEATPTVASRQAAVDAFALALLPRQPKVAYVELANESWQDGFPIPAGHAELQALAVRLRRSLPDLPIALSSPPPPGYAEARALYGGSQAADLMTFHTYRGNPPDDGLWRAVRDNFTIPAATDSRAWVSNEPIGPGVSVTQDDDPIRLAMNAAAVALAGGAGYTFHSHIGTYYPDGQTFADVPNFEKTAALLRTVADRAT